MHPSYSSFRRVAALTLGLALAAGGAGWAAAEGEAPASSSRSASASMPDAASPSAGLRTCTVADLELSMGRKEAAAGSLYWPIRFTNASGSACALRGYPGVSVLNAGHQQIGAPASPTGQPYDTVEVTPGATVTAVVRTTNGPIGGPCRPAGSSLRVYPPASYDAELIPADLTVCSNVFEIGPVTTQTTF